MKIIPDIITALTGQPLPHRPFEDIDLTGVIDGTLSARPTPMALRDFDDRRLMSSKPEPCIDPSVVTPY